jgi:folate-binding protein YgfZ
VTASSPLADLGAPFFYRVPAGGVRVTGNDRVDFIQGQVSNDVRALSVPGVTRALLLSVRGQVEFEVTAFRLADHLYLQTHEGLAGAVAERLRRYVVFDDVHLEDRGSGLSVVHAVGIADKFGFDVNGPAAQALPALGGSLLAARRDRSGVVGADLLAPPEQVDALLEALRSSGARELDDREAEGLRVLAGLADAHRDAFAGLLPQECGLEGAVSYRKGCYVGQEIMARVEARASTQRTLGRVSGKEPFPRGAPIRSGEREVGRTGNPVEAEQGWTALAVVRKDLPAEAELLAGGTPVRLEGP